MTGDGDRDEGAPDRRQRSPVLMCFPFLALNRPCRIGRWELLTAEAAFSEGLWASESFRQDAERMLGLFRYGVGHYRLENPTLIARAGRKFTGESPEAAERDALTATAAFGALDSNRPRGVHGWTSWVVAENVDYWEFPVSGDGELMLSLGRRYRTRFHDTWGENRPIIGPAVLEPAHSHHVRIDEDVAAILHETLLSDTERSTNLAAAIRFFVDSWRNHPSVVGVADWTFDYSTVVCSQQTALSVADSVAFDTRSFGFASWRERRESLLVAAVQLTGHTWVSTPGRAVLECAHWPHRSHRWEEYLGRMLAYRFEVCPPSEVAAAADALGWRAGLRRISSLAQGLAESPTGQSLGFDIDRRWAELGSAAGRGDDWIHLAPLRRTGSPPRVAYRDTARKVNWAAAPDAVAAVVST